MGLSIVCHSYGIHQSVSYLFFYRYAIPTGFIISCFIFFYRYVIPTGFIVPYLFCFSTDMPSLRDSLSCFSFIFLPICHPYGIHSSVSLLFFYRYAIPTGFIVPYLFCFSTDMPSLRDSSLRVSFIFLPICHPYGIGNGFIELLNPS